MSDHVVDERSTRPTVSVVVPTYKRRHVIGRALDSVFAQTFTDFEVIVVDDHGDDGTIDFLAGLDDPRLRYIEHESNRGGNAARTTGIDAARGEWIAFLDSDDAWHPTKLAKQLELLRARGPEYGLCGVGMDHYAPDGTLERTQIPQIDGWVEMELLAHNHLGGFSAIMVRRSALMEAGGLDPTMPAAQDWDFYVRVSALVAVCVVPEALVDYMADPNDPVRITVDNGRVVKGLRRMWARVEANRSRLSEQQHRDAVRYFSFMLANIGAVGDVTFVLRSGLASYRPRDVVHGGHMLVRSVRNEVRRAAEGQRRAADQLRHTKGRVRS